MKLRDYFIQEFEHYGTDVSHQDARDWVADMKRELGNVTVFENANTVFAIRPQKTVWEVSSAVCSTEDKFNFELGEGIAVLHMYEGKFINFPRRSGESAEAFAFNTFRVWV